MNCAHQKIIALFGPTDPLVWSPRAMGEAKLHLLYKAKECSPCYHDDGNFVACPFTGAAHRACMTEITPQEVLEALTSR
jgi:ADP-heptose:LPS heptosyltransferase